MASHEGTRQEEVCGLSPGLRALEALGAARKVVGIARRAGPVTCKCQHYSSVLPAITTFNANWKCPVQSSAVIMTSQEMLWAPAGRHIISTILPWQILSRDVRTGLGLEGAALAERLLLSAHVAVAPALLAAKPGWGTSALWPATQKMRSFNASPLKSQGFPPLGKLTRGA